MIETELDAPAQPSDRAMYLEPRSSTMTIDKLKVTLVAGLLLIGTSGLALAQADRDDHDAHHPEGAGQTLPDADPNGASAAMPDGMSGMMEMMTPEMMQRMMRMMGEGGMPGMMGGMRGGQMAEGSPAPGMTGGGMMGREMMSGDAMPMGPMMRGHYGAMGGHGLGPDALYGMPQGSVSEMTPARVEAFLSRMLERHGNPRLELGSIEEAEDGSIIAEIVTTDGSLVQRLSFNQYPGLFRQID
jgi:hypothetical protein